MYLMPLNCTFENGAYGKFNFIYMRASHRHERVKGRQLKLIGHPELRRLIRLEGLQREGRQFIERWEEQMFIMLCRDNGTQ